MPSGLFDKELITRFRVRALTNKQRPPAMFLLDHANEDIADRLSLINREFPLALNLGAHDGRLSRQLMANGAVGEVISSDTALPLVRLCPAPAVQLDEGLFPFKDGIFDLIVSSFSLQWVNEPANLLLAIRRSLKADGVFIGAVIGDQSLRELRQALMQAEEEIYGGISPRVAPFSDVRDLGAALLKAGFTLPVTDRDVLKVRYDDAYALMSDIRQMGGANALMARNRRPVSRRYFQRVDEIYRDQFAEEDGRVFATIVIHYLMGWAPHPDQPKPLRPGSGRVSLTKVLKPGKPQDD